MTAVDRRVIVVGAGGHAKVVIEALRSTRWEPAGLLDPHAAIEKLLGVPLLGGDSKGDELFRAGYRRAFIAIGRNDLRCTLGQRFSSIGFELITIVHPSAVVAHSAVLGRGVLVMPQAVINAEARIDDYAIINTAAVVEHDCIVGRGVHIGPRSVMGGQVVIEEEVLFGIGAVARPLSSIGARAIVGAGAVVIGQIRGGQVVIGAPARPLVKKQIGSDN
jgi:UDP-perosamine 4-acetyltransferase